MDYRKITMVMDDEHYVDLLFKQYVDGGDWICQMSDEFMRTLGEIAEECVEHDH